MYLWSKVDDFLSTGFHFRDCFRKALTGTDEKSGRKFDFLSCWLPLLDKGLCHSWKICTQNTPTVMCFEPSICSFESSCFQGVKPFFRWTIRQSRQQGKNAEKKKCNEESVACVKAMVDAGARVSLQETAVCIDIDSSSVLGILKKLGFRKVSARWIPHLMMPKNKRVRLQYWKALLKIYRTCDPKRLDERSKGDGTWVCRY